MPFTNDPAKQVRYVAYLRSQSTPEHPELVPPQLPGQTSEAYHKELSDYSKSAGIFKPVSGAMASRFTTAAVVETGPKAVEGLHQPTHDQEPTPAQRQEEKEREKDVKQPEEEAQSSKAHAARTGMYVALTREIVPWQPSRLLCKRFGVKDPNPDITTDTPMPGVPSAGGNNTWKAEEALAEADLQTATGSASAGPSTSTAGGRRTARDLENIGLGEDDMQGHDTLTYVRPSMDIFKAIFASDDEDSDDEVQEGDSQEKDAPNAGSSAGLPQQPEEKEEKPTTDADAVGAVPPPPHLGQQHVVPSPSYEPRSAATATTERPPAGGAEAVVVVDAATFKPVFVPRAERETQKQNDKKDRRGKDNKKRARAIVSFDNDDDEGDGGAAALVIAPQKPADKDKARRKKKRRKEEKEEDADTWVEKAPPQVVASFDSARPADSEGEARVEASVLPSTSSVSEGPPRGRKRAIDFL